MLQSHSLKSETTMAFSILQTLSEHEGVDSNSKYVIKVLQHEQEVKWQNKPVKHHVEYIPHPTTVLPSA
jgi:hypothetical protein